ncbi:hypothetical protein [Breoghania sp.]|uniref:hypothetical protein n=1 Tax=Breoghania sp. TaxID=2065378 RepID=UPI002631B694|nr:hypothetical protein [Breoghania sp.]MDJ0930988.1 hypothetical protein [Breoghania sp.]
MAPRNALIRFRSNERKIGSAASSDHDYPIRARVSRQPVDGGFHVIELLIGIEYLGRFLRPEPTFADTGNVYAKRGKAG